MQIYSGDNLYFHYLEQTSYKHELLYWSTSRPNHVASLLTYASATRLPRIPISHSYLNLFYSCEGSISFPGLYRNEASDPGIFVRNYLSLAVFSTSFVQEEQAQLHMSPPFEQLETLRSKDSEKSANIIFGEWI